MMDSTMGKMDMGSMMKGGMGPMMDGRYGLDDEGRYGADDEGRYGLDGNGRYGPMMGGMGSMMKTPGVATGVLCCICRFQRREKCYKKILHTSLGTFRSRRRCGLLHL